MAKSKAEKPPSTRNLNQVLIRRANKPKYDNVPTDRDGVFLHLEDGEPTRELPIRELIKFKYLGRLAAIRTINYKKQQAKLNNTNDKIKNMARKYPGLGGVVEEDYSMTVYPTYKIDFDQDILRSALKAADTLALVEGVDVSVSIPPGRVTPRGKPITVGGVQRAFEGAMKNLGFKDQEDRDSVMTVTPTLSIGEEEIGKMIIEGRIALPETAGTVEESFTVKAGPIPDKLPKPSVLNP